MTSAMAGRFLWGNDTRGGFFGDGNGGGTSASHNILATTECANVGSLAHAYQSTHRIEEDISGNNHIYIQAITSMPVYEGKSMEELRMEDYAAGNRGRSRGDTAINNTITNNSRTATSNIEPTIAHILVGSLAHGYKPTHRIDGGISGINHIYIQAITSMPAYEDKSMEELRMEDYVARNRGSCHTDTTIISSTRITVGNNESTTTEQTTLAGSLAHPYQTTRQHNRNGSSIYIEAIVGMEAYKYKSMEELRMEDYAAGNRGLKPCREDVDMTASDDTASPCMAKKCVVCMDQNVTHVLIPCGHISLCGSCSDTVNLRMMKWKCPECRASIRDVMRVYGRVVD